MQEDIRGAGVKADFQSKRPCFRREAEGQVVHEHITFVVSTAL
jgi:hypothetical protein